MNRQTPYLRLLSQSEINATESFLPILFKTRGLGISFLQTNDDEHDIRFLGSVWPENMPVMLLLKNPNATQISNLLEHY